MGEFFSSGKCCQLFFAKRGKKSLKIRNCLQISELCFFDENLQMFHLFSCFHQNFVQKANNAWIIALGLIALSSCSRTWQFLGRELVCPPLALGGASPLPPTVMGKFHPIRHQRCTVCSKMLSCWLHTITPGSFQKEDLEEDGDLLPC